jgi:hypothetical protein
VRKTQFKSPGANYKGRFSRTPRVFTTSVRSHTIDTEARTLDDALRIIQTERVKKRKRLGSGTKNTNRMIDNELGYGDKITLPKLRFLELPPED